ncbi:MAG TPA: hypothetical protein VF708_21920 [Pyrinomonadaceae bacterium]|jgi:hypothetical protein
MAGILTSIMIWEYSLAGSESEVASVAAWRYMSFIKQLRLQTSSGLTGI